ncbi:1-deoxy-D-xylulose-5-phosphate synthase [Clostridium baratii]|uniref:1-deoxy-D-xylulose-5-phosphate synthase n=1 Tax=Clostridium baratii TaxID=1561 RepID=A0A174RQF5_9CLOT|nr:1-deoxy-D-xylulose-5-phosphate synthase [Clostridium baratii]OPF52344.1 1-deoxy-D-xylulose-5-phosphate synthase [Clostridium baratii]OPF55794.1 1-deoxy-D-xylulose-5-phosphate synthase [Clostridium baratii]OPF56826.1 1-deoxy-D-xylulose-5-phosphate synthase [Clostridium baratii]OPF59825.1 1-deoxy-D-xylulose-5-phosphate synthase [Clostridium baratii]CUP87804.1 1-deoxy-D-xylulose-5-phosphate synthase [Clostridium baratii]
MESILNEVNSPVDLKKVSLDKLNILAEEIRNVLIKKVNGTGGHMGPNLGMVEATIAMHYVFNSPIDKIVFDVSHQSYTHKILTGRKEAFINPEKYYTISGYTNPEESEHDYFTVGHTSTSVSLATGLAKGRDLKGDNENIIAVIGDGSLSGGEAYEGLNNAAVLNSNIIIVVNDNGMSIADNHGGLYGNLALLRETKGKAELNFFKAIGFDYYFVEDGNNIESLVETFRKVKDVDHPVVIHMNTIKGKGLKVAEENKEHWHWILPGEVDGTCKSNMSGENYATITSDYITEKYKEDRTVIAISPATPGVTGFTPEFRENAGIHYTDVGIAEEHAVAFSSGIAANGGKPIIGIMSSFIQRTYDQLSQDLCLNNNSVTILVFGGGISGGDATHLGTFDIPLISNIPNMVYLAPTSKEEYLAMLDWSVEQNDHPVAIRIPSGKLISTGIKDTSDYSILNKYKVEEEGNKVAIIALGSFLELGRNVKKALKEKMGIDATVINPRFITGIDKELLESLKDNHELVITLEDGMLDGGFGEKITRFYGASDMKVLNFGSNKEFTDRISLDELYERYHLKEDLILDDIAKCIK